MEGVEDESFGYAMQLVTGSALPMTLHAAFELGIFEVLAKAGPGAYLSASQIAEQLGADNPQAPAMLERILALLAAHRILAFSTTASQKLYTLTPVATYFVPDEDGISLGPLMTLIQDKVFLNSWSKLKDAVLHGGIPFNKVHRINAFEYSDRDPRFNQVFNDAMLNHTTIVTKRMLRSYKGFENLGRLVDVGGGLGGTLSLITSKYPSIRGINFDLPHVIRRAPPSPGVENMEGDMFQSIPNGDAIFMKWILHDWSDDHCLKLLKNCYNAIPEQGKVIVMEVVLPTIPDDSIVTRGKSQVDVLVMTEYPGGKERTKEEFMALAKGAGFSGIRYECCVFNYWVMEFYK